ncbi:MAG: sulfite exporter TauE/SafE family protein [Acidimicrobiia bacterium]
MTWVISIGIGLVAGLAAGVGGIGGGAIMVPAMVFLLAMPQHTAEGTSLVAIIGSAVTGTYVHAKNRAVDLRGALLMGLAGVLGAQGGAYWALRLEATTLKRIFGGFLLITGGRMALGVLARRLRAGRTER